MSNLINNIDSILESLKDKSLKKTGVLVITKPLLDIYDKYLNNQEYQETKHKLLVFITNLEACEDTYFNRLAKYYYELGKKEKDFKEYIDSIVYLYRKAEALNSSVAANNLNVIFQQNPHINKKPRKPKILTCSLDEIIKLITSDLEKISKDKDLMQTATSKKVSNTKKYTINREVLKNLKEDLNKLVKGQDVAINSVVTQLMHKAAGLTDDAPLIFSMMFAGTTGTGKTELAETLAKLLDLNVITYNLSEYQESHTISAMLGSPAGYAGSNGTNTIAHKINENPNSIIVFEEVDKAHPDILTAVMQLLDKGTVTSRSGITANANSCIFIATTNAGAECLITPVENMTPEIQKQEHTECIENLKTKFKPEVINRFDDIVVFNKLSRDIVEKIFKEKFLQKTIDKLAKKNVTLKLTTDAIEYFINKGYNQSMGARELKRVEKKYLFSPLANAILFGELQKQGSATVDYLDSKLQFEFSEMQG